MARRTTARGRNKNHGGLGTGSIVAERPAPLYLLFAGLAHSPRGGLGDLVETFECEETARTAFRDLRLRKDSGRAWAQLAVVNQKGGIRPLCWFGIGARPERPPTSLAHDTSASLPRKGMKIRALRLFALVALLSIVMTGSAVVQPQEQTVRVRTGTSIRQQKEK